MDLPDEEYRGPATLHLADTDLPVDIRLWARFEPIEGRFRWAGRTTPDPALGARVTSGLTAAEITITGRTMVKLSEPDPYGSVRLSGSGTPPWFPGKDR